MKYSVASCAVEDVGEQRTSDTILNILFRQRIFWGPLETWCGPMGGHVVHVENHWSTLLP